jgi:sensor histidine kinase YesM
MEYINLVPFVLVPIVLVAVGYCCYLNNRVAIARRDAELSNTKLDIMRSQIRQHFLSNTLLAIWELCETMPSEAAIAVEEFAVYLRYNLDSLDRTQLSPFKDELRHACIYLSLERRRFGDSVNWNTDIEVTDFCLPPLTLQPLVENAIRHGILKKREGGTVTICTRRNGSGIVIQVMDDGAGFDPSVKLSSIQGTQGGDACNHIGIANIRQRLQMRLGGDLFVSSVVGEGTTAAITIPAQQADSA